jgi:hypothetical protein
MDLFHLDPIASYSTPLVFSEPFFPLFPSETFTPLAIKKQKILQEKIWLLNVDNMMEEC